MNEWNKLDLNIRNSESLTSFKSKVLKFIRPSENSIFLCNNPKGIQLLTRLTSLQTDTFQSTFKGVIQLVRTQNFPKN